MLGQRRNASISQPMTLHSYRAQSQSPLRMALLVLLAEATRSSLTHYRPEVSEQEPSWSQLDQELRAPVSAGNAGTTPELRKEGSNPEVVARSSSTPLGISAADGSVELTRLLLEVGSDPSINAEEDITASSPAGEANREEVVPLLENYQ